MSIRLAAILNATPETVFFFGYGTYAGEEVPPPDVVGPEGLSLSRLGKKDHKILLDDGEIVWGVEAHMVLEENFLTMIRDRKVQKISVSRLRKFVKESPEAVEKWKKAQLWQQVRFN